jgi:ATP-dependent Clp protease protease subunit
MIVLPAIKERKLYLADQVDQKKIAELASVIIDINESDDEIEEVAKISGFKYERKPIKLYIDSYGGRVYQCFGLLGVMEHSKTPVHTIVTGCAMSCGFLISITGHKRFGYNKSTYLYHQVSGGMDGKIADMEEEVIETKRLQKMIEEHTLQHTKITKERLKEVYEKKQDWFINTHQALQLNIIDEIIK